MRGERVPVGVWTVDRPVSVSGDGSSTGGAPRTEDGHDRRRASTLPSGLSRQGWKTSVTEGFLASRALPGVGAIRLQLPGFDVVVQHHLKELPGQPD